MADTFDLGVEEDGHIEDGEESCGEKICPTTYFMVPSKERDKSFFFVLIKGRGKGRNMTNECSDS